MWFLTSPSGARGPVAARGRRRKFSAALWAFLFVWILLLVAAPLGNAQESREDYIAFIDCSGSLTLDAGAGRGTRFEAIRDLALEEISSRLESGVNVRIVPFDEVPLDGVGSVWTPGKAALADQMSEIRFYLDAYKPRVNRRRTAIWDTVAAILPKVASNQHSVSVAVYTDGEDNASRRTLADLEQQLKDQRRFSERGDVAVKLWVWSPARPQAPRVAVVLESTEVPIVDVGEFQNNTVRRSIPLEARIARSAAPGDRIAPDVKVEAIALTKGAPNLVVKARLDSLVTKVTPKSDLSIYVEGSFPGGKWEYAYDLRFVFSFHSDLPGLAHDDMDQQVAGGREVRLVISSKPTVQFKALETDVRLRPGETRDVQLLVHGNPAAGGMNCQIRALVPRGLSAGFLDNDDPTIPISADAPGTPDVLDVLLKPNGESRKVFLRFKGEAPLEQKTVQLSASITGSLDSASVAVLVQKPVIRPVLLRKGERTVLAEDENRDRWQEMLCGPLILRSDAPAHGVNATLSIDDAGRDVEIAFDKNGLQHQTISVEGSANVPIYARYKTRQPASAPSAPNILITLDHPELATLDSQRLTLEGALGLAKPDFYILPEDGAQRTDTASERVLSLDQRTARVNQPDEREVLLEWNTAAVGTRIDVIPETAAGGNMVTSIEPVTRAGDESVLTLVSPWQLEIRDDKTPSQQKVKAMSARLRIHLQSLPQSQKATSSLRFSPAPGSPPMSPWALKLPYDITPTVVNAEIEKGQYDAAPVYLGASMIVARLRATVDGSPVGIRARFEPTDPAATVSVGFGDKAGDLVTVSPQAPSGVAVYANPGLDPARAGTKIPGSLVLEPVADDPNVLIHFGSQTQKTIRVPFTFDVRAWSLKAFYNGAVCAGLPPAGPSFPVEKRGSTLRTSTFHYKFYLALEGGELPENVAARKLTAKVSDAAGIIRSAGFQVEGNPEPQPEIPISDLNKVQGLVVSMDPALDKSRTDSLRTGEIALEVPDFPLKLALPVRMSVNPPVPVILWFAIVLGLVLVGVVFLRVMKTQRGTQLGKVPAGDPALVGAAEDSATWTGGLLDSSSARAAASQPVPPAGGQPAPQPPAPPRNPKAADPPAGSQSSGESWL